jgi:truncated hemoglobin YjbI
MERKMADTLYKRLGGYDAIAAVADDLLVRLQADPRLRAASPNPVRRCSDSNTYCSLR